MNNYPPFDSAAPAYDAQFTNTFCGRAQRNRVWKILESKILSGKKAVLELNCGTGEDALWLASKGHPVYATDNSPAMIEMASSKASGQVPAVQWGLLDLRRPEFSERVDLVFSNFGGLNCLAPEELNRLSGFLYSILNTKGSLALVLMSRRCWWERVYFWYKRKPGEARRRQRNDAVNVQVNGVSVPTWYYSPSEIRTLFGAYFQYRLSRPIGIVIPPSYLNALMEKMRFLKPIVRFAEYILGSFAFLSDYADHYLIVLEKK